LSSKSDYSNRRQKQRVARQRLMRLVPRCYLYSPRKTWVATVGSEDGFSTCFLRGMRPFLRNPQTAS